MLIDETIKNYPILSSKNKSWPFSFIFKWLSLNLKFTEGSLKVENKEHLVGFVVVRYTSITYQCDLRQLSTKHALCNGCISNSCHTLFKCATQ